MPIYLLIGMTYGWPATLSQSFTYSGNYSGTFTTSYVNTND
jgi:hypothetical protein